MFILQSLSYTRLPKDTRHVPWLWAACMFSQPCMSLARAPAILHGNRYHVFFLIFKAESRSELKMCWFVYLIFLWPYPSRKWVESMFNLVFSMCHCHPAHSWIASESWIASILLSLRNHHLLKFIAASVARFGFGFGFGFGFSVAISIAPGSPLKYIIYFFEFCYNFLPIFFLHRPPCQMHWPLHQAAPCRPGQ